MLSRSIWKKAIPALTLFALVIVAGYFVVRPTSNALAEPSGADLAALTFQAGDGSALTLSDFQGKAILLNIWATWCPPCRKEMPSLDRLQALKGSDAFEVVALSIDKTGLDKVQPFYDEIGIKELDIYLDPPGSAMRTLALVGLPTTLLIDAQGKEIMRWVGPREWDQADVIAEIEQLIADRAAAEQ